MEEIEKKLEKIAVGVWMFIGSVLILTAFFGMIWLTAKAALTAMEIIELTTQHTKWKY